MELIFKEKTILQKIEDVINDPTIKGQVIDYLELTSQEYKELNEFYDSELSQRDKDNLKRIEENKQYIYYYCGIKIIEKE